MKTLFCNKMGTQELDYAGYIKTGIIYVEQPNFLSERIIKITFII